MDQETLLRKILKLGYIKKTDKILVTCAGYDDYQILKDLGFTNFLVTSAYERLRGVRKYKKADAQNLPFKDNFFDASIVNAGLHHCDSPHRALTEMYRVSKKAVIVHEAQDSFLVRVFVKLKLVFDYETGHEAGQGGGLNDTDIPNYIYRWTTREIFKTINSYDPTKIHNIIFFRSLKFYPFYLNQDEYLGKNIVVKIFGKQIVGSILSFSVWIINLLARNQGNDFAFIIRKDKSPYQKWFEGANFERNLPGRFKKI